MMPETAALTERVAALEQKVEELAALVRRLVVGVRVER